jgi:hypothetical protein
MSRSLDLPEPSFDARLLQQNSPEFHEKQGWNNMPEMPLYRCNRCRMPLHLNKGQRKGKARKSRSDKLAYRFLLRDMPARRVAGVLNITLKNKLLLGATVVFVLTAGQVCAAEGNVPDERADTSNAIIAQYLRATQSRPDTAGEGAVEIEINASVPRLKKEGRLRVLRQMSKVGQITYRVLGFQGDNSVKNQVIARYLQAEQEGHGKQNLAVTPENYKFKFRGERGVLGKDVYVFQLSPRHKRVGLFKGELWLDAGNYLPVYEKGRLVKNPSIFFKKVDFERAFAIQNGAPVPAHLTSTIHTRLIGKVELDVSYLNSAPNAACDVPGEEVETSSASLTSSH